MCPHRERKRGEGHTLGSHPPIPSLSKLWDQRRAFWPHAPMCPLRRLLQFALQVPVTSLKASSSLLLSWAPAGPPPPHLTFSLGSHNGSLVLLLTPPLVAPDVLPYPLSLSIDGLYVGA